VGYTVRLLDSYEPTRVRLPENATSNCVTVGGEGEQRDEGNGDERSPVLYWMPFYRITSQRMDLHPMHPAKAAQDCTHYCYTPYLWDPLIENLARAVEDRSLEGLSSKC
jgi:hypothetical protein